MKNSENGASSGPTDSRVKTTIARSGLPMFGTVPIPELLMEIDEAMNALLAVCERVKSDPSPPSWSSLVEPLELAKARLRAATAAPRHLAAVQDTPELRQAWQSASMRLSVFYTQLGQDDGLYQRFKRLRQSAEFDALNTIQRRLIDKTIEDFVLGGVALEGEARQRFTTIAERMTELRNLFSNHVLDSTQGFSYEVSDDAVLQGLPQSLIDDAARKARNAGRTGWTLGIDPPTYRAVMLNAHDSGLRKNLYLAYMTRASADGPGGSAFDNSALIDEILALRFEQAALLGFEHYAALSLARKMASSADEVFEFLRNLGRQTRPLAIKQLEALQAHAARCLDLNELAPWDIAYCSESLRHARYDIDQESLRRYFPVEQVLSGMFLLVEELFGVRVQHRNDIPVWHDSVRYLDIIDADGDTIAGCYLDLYAREGKRGGAWMDECRPRVRLGTDSWNPVAFLTCNFTAPNDERPALLTHDELTTLFHELGHCLHHMLTRIDLPSVGGLGGVEWDAVELPSQLMENWCYEPQTLAACSAHIETGKPLPESMVEALRASRTYNGALDMLRQLEFALFDLSLHACNPQKLAGQSSRRSAVLDVLWRIRDEIAVVPHDPRDQLPNSFSHIFAGGYAAGYYSYKWAEVLAADAFEVFETEGVRSPAAGRRFRREILETGSTRSAMRSFEAFKGRKPAIDALLRLTGIA